MDAHSEIGKLAHHWHPFYSKQVFCGSHSSDQTVDFSMLPKRRRKLCSDQLKIAPSYTYPHNLQLTPWNEYVIFRIITPPRTQPQTLSSWACAAVWEHTIRNCSEAMGAADHRLGLKWRLGMDWKMPNVLTHAHCQWGELDKHVLHLVNSAKPFNGVAILPNAWLLELHYCLMCFRWVYGLFTVISRSSCLAFPCFSPATFKNSHRSLSF